MKQTVNPVANGVGSIVNTTHDFQTVREVGKILPDYLYFYDGSTASAVANGVLTLKGCSPSAPLGGLAIPFKDILESSAYTVDCVSNPTAQKVRLECVKEKCNSIFRVGVSIQRTFDAKSHPFVLPPKTYNVDGLPCEGTTNACLDAVNDLARRINSDPERTHNATVITEGSAPNQIAHLELEAIEAGVNYIISGSENFYPPSVLVVPMGVSFTSDVFSELGKNPCLPPTNKCYRAVIFRFRQFLQMDGTVASSSLAKNENYEVSSIKSVIFLFDKDDSAQVTAATALLTQLDAGGNPYISKICPNCSKVTKPFRFCIKRTDAGTDAASATFAADYPALANDYFRANYTSGVSYYTVQKSSSSAITPVGSDVIVAGDCGPDDIPCTNC